MVRCGARTGFTLIELIVVMAIVALLISIAAPRYFVHLERSKEAVLRSDLAMIRDALDKHFGDTGRYPDSLNDLVRNRYLRSIPPDPLTESAQTWVTMAPADRSQGGVYDVRSGATGNDANGVPYSAW